MEYILTIDRIPGFEQAKHIYPQDQQELLVLFASLCTKQLELFSRFEFLVELTIIPFMAYLKFMKNLSWADFFPENFLVLCLSES